MSASRGKKIAGWVLVVLLAIAFLLAGVGKLAGAQTEMFAEWGYPAWFATLIGVLEVAGAIGLLIPRLTKPAILGLTGLMLGAAYTHLANGEGLEVLRPAIFAALLWLVWWLRTSN